MLVAATCNEATLVLKTGRYYVRNNLSCFIVQRIVTLPKYGHDAVNIRRPKSTDILRYTEFRVSERERAKYRSPPAFLQ